MSIPTDPFALPAVLPSALPASTPVLVSGASGQLGRRVVELLLDQGQAVIAASRHPERLAELGARGATLRRIDFDDPRSVADAVVGVERAIFISTDAVGARAEAQRAAVQAAAEAGLAHLVYTSVVSVAAPEMPVGPDHLVTEAAIRAAFPSHTILRNSLYAELLVGAAAGAAASGQLVTARGAGQVAWVSREDCARAAAAALVDGFSGARVLDITGPEAISDASLAALIAQLSGRPVQHVAVPAEALVEGLVQQAGLPRPLAELLAAFDGAAERGLLASASPHLGALTGQAGAPVAAVLRAAALAQGWAAAG